jgi:general secretion pathway protein A
MYQQFFGLRELPFELTANPKFLFMTPRHREALSNLQYGLATHKTVTVLIGEAGTGKTTLLQTALQAEGCRNIRFVYVNNPALTRDEFVETLARGFGLTAAASASKATMLAELEALLQQQRALGRSLALVIDEAQRLSDELLEEIRLLANIETADEKLLPLVLAGQPELSDRLRDISLRQLRQRISLRCEIGAFELQETAAYMDHRIRTAGGQSVKLFTREAVTMIHDRSRGIPRVINVLGDNALVGAFAKGVQRVTSDVVLHVLRDFDLADTAIQSLEPSDAVEAGAQPTSPLFVAAPAAAADTPAMTAPEGEAPSDAGESAADREMFGPVTRRRRFSLFR